MAKFRKRPPESWTYVLQGDRALPLEQQTRFTLKPLTVAELAAVRDELNRTQEFLDGSMIGVTRVRQVGVTLALSHIVSIENFPVGAAKPWPNAIDDRANYLEQFDFVDVIEIGNEIFRGSSIAGDGNIIKNSSPPERTPTSGENSPESTSTTASLASGNLT